ncbi:hypothetical protein MATL_G00032230 [Megalops atlanticus]|uniref:Sec16 Sec23-binding domain-containing protein n=1 Tax=Megalops atlanticus TaxID=7932 RepID=A0A9D3QGP8_MEGAT|nr:hypothetical protein MATL_G00032230 [Megalops atlanticus]
MDPRGPPWRGFGPQEPQYYGPRPGYPPRSCDWEGYNRPNHLGEAYHPHPDSRAKQRLPADPRSRSYVSSPHPRLDFSPNNWSTPISRSGYDPHWSSGWLHSRQGYDHHPHNYSSWHTTEDYGYYDHGYDTRHHKQPGAGRWTQNIPDQEYRRSETYQDGQYQQDWTDTTYTEQYSNQPTENHCYDPVSPSEGHARENGESSGEVSLYGPGALVESKMSGLSSSSYELSQYIDDAEQSNPPPQSHWSALTEHATVPHVEAPLKFCLPHVRVSFGPGGQLIRVSPSLVSQGDPALVELHSLEIILAETQEQEEMREFPGPLAREDLHKVDAISFALQRAETCLKDESLQDSASFALLWMLLVLLCRQNGRITGSDIAELLMRDSCSPGQCDSKPGPSDGPSLIDLSEGPTPEMEVLDSADLLTGAPEPSAKPGEKALQAYTQLLLSGRKKEALELAMKSDLWGHALFLASKMDNRSYTTVLNRFMGSLSTCDPLQTLFQLLSGRIPTITMCYGSERWGDWKPHLAVMLSNETGDIAVHQKAIVTMGDTLATRGMIGAAHFCYLTARVAFGVYTSSAEKLVLLGSSHSLPFLKFARNSAIQCTEVFEYSQSLGDPSFFIPSFQVYKFLYACRLLDCGLAPQAFHYCEVIGKALLKQHTPSTVLLGEVIKLADRLKQSDPQFGDVSADRSAQDPDWLAQLRLRQQGAQMGSCGFTDTCESAVEEHTMASEENRVCPDPYTDDHELSTNTMIDDIQHPDAQHLQFENATEPYTPYTCTQQASWQAHSQPAAPPVTGGQDCNLVLTNGTYSQTAPLNPTLNGQLSAGQGVENQPDTCGMGEVMPSPEEQRQASQQTPAQEKMAMGQGGAQPEKGSKSGWFSGWFKSKPKDIQKEGTEDLKHTSVEKETPAPPLSSPPPPPLDPFPCLPASTGFNPFSKNAGRLQSFEG